MKLLRFPYSHRRFVAPLEGQPALVLDHVCVNRPDESAMALNEVSLRVPIGARWALVGPNGAGKSTLLKAVAGLLQPRSGEILIYGHPVGACHHRVAYLPQRGDIDWRFPISLRRLVMTGRYVHFGWLQGPAPEDWAIIDRTLTRLGLSDLANRQIGQLSGGQQQRTLLARALVQGAELILLDEPMNAVDNDTRAIIAGVLDDLRAEGKTVVIATHDLSRIEADYDGVLGLRDGREVPMAEVMLSLRQLA